MVVSRDPDFAKRWRFFMARPLYPVRELGAQ
jgi:hypothetical protein